MIRARRCFVCRRRRSLIPSALSANPRRIGRLFVTTTVDTRARLATVTIQPAMSTSIVAPVRLTARVSIASRPASRSVRSAVRGSADARGRKSTEKIEVAAWLSFCKLVLHPAFVAIAAIYLFPLDPFSAGVIIAAAALPVAGNVFMLAQHYGVAPQRVSAAILVSTAISIVTVSLVIGWVSQL